jgi:hypothetical protein
MLDNRLINLIEEYSPYEGKFKVRNEFVSRPKYLWG